MRNKKLQWSYPENFPQAMSRWLQALLFFSRINKISLNFLLLSLKSPLTQLTFFTTPYLFSLLCFSSFHKIFLLPLASSRFFFFFLVFAAQNFFLSLFCSFLHPLKSFSQLFSHGFQTPLPRCLSLPLMLCFRSRNLAAQAYSPIVSESSWYVSPMGSFKKRSLLQPTISYTCCQNFLKCSKNVVQNIPQTKK